MRRKNGSEFDIVIAAFLLDATEATAQQDEEDGASTGVFVATEEANEDDGSEVLAPPSEGGTGGKK